MNFLEKNVSASAAHSLDTALARMKRAHLDAGPASEQLRRDRIDRTIQLLVDHHAALADAVSADFGNRSRQQTLLADVGSSLGALRYNREHLAEWMQPVPQAAPFPGVEAHLYHQALGVVGIVSPWNFPITLAFSPLAAIFAAGNRAMLKPSELTPRTSALIAELVAARFDADEFTVVLGDAAVGAAFTALPFDHLIFTGSTRVGRHVMRAAAENLVPVTLELGGKSPVPVSRSADLRSTAERLLTVKTFNAGQICISPDYVFLPHEMVDDFVAAAQHCIGRMYPTLKDNPDFTSIINPANFDRLQGHLADARDKGARVIEINPAGEDLSDREARKIAPTLILDATDDMLVLQEEIFGPILPIKTYTSFDEVIAYVNSRPKPLAAYYFGSDAAEIQRFTERTSSGALVVNDAMTHVFVEALPFGGVGASGMGAYHGIHGFRTFSHAKPVLTQSPGAESNLPMRAPYGDLVQAVISGQLQGEGT
ncbi:MAG: coniferyl aldehyde dehydrogenase [Janthinobacterium lividum]